MGGEIAVWLGVIGAASSLLGGFASGLFRMARRDATLSELVTALRRMELRLDDFAHRLRDDAAALRERQERSVAVDASFDRRLAVLEARDVMRSGRSRPVEG